MTQARCRIEKYDASVTKPPFTFIQLGEFTIDDQEVDDGGLTRALKLRTACRSQGYTFKSYSLSDEDGFVYDVLVYGEMEGIFNKKA